MPIRTFLRGVLYVSVTAIMAFTVIAWSVPQVQAKKNASSTTKQGVRTSTTLQRRPRARVAYRAPVLPREIEASSESLQAVERALQTVGMRYRWGGVSPTTGFDCSGLVRYIYGDQASVLPRSAYGMYSAINKTDTLRSGDIIFFGRGRVRHAAIYIGNGQVVHASTPRTGVRVDSVNTLTRVLGYMGTGRI